ncbi:OadG family protein [Arcobacter sp. FWKO B]|uniref:OadG family protein n=1 Tax=Arcobacter sp. FWKO B TaxID=2593672 RepID=UPI0018A61047|nr:OadG family protein [Arcobacter sp. FWKO B]QOG11345.1 sodium pump decarboxylase subunit gamma [Arcobacter sp. FWKO B]
MEEVNLVSEALKFMALGMGIVFVFLILLVFILKLQAKILQRYFPQEEKVVTKQWQPSVIKSNDKASKIAAIIAAVQHHKNIKG